MEPEFGTFSLDLTANPKDETDWAFTGNLATKLVLNSTSFKLEAFLVYSRLWNPRRVTESVFELCKILHGKRSSRPIVKLFRRFATLPKVCPINPGTYGVTNFSMRGFRSPVFEYLGFSGKGLATLTLQTKRNRKIVSFMKAMFYFELKSR